MARGTGHQSVAASPGVSPAVPQRAPLVSVVIPCLNAAGFVRDAIDSVLLQECDGVQIIVVNDGSPDAPELRRVIAPYGERVELIDRPHSGLSSTRNAGIAAARGEFLAFLDADDKWKPGFLDAQLALLRRCNADLVYADAELFGERVAPGTRFMDHFPSSGEVTAAALLLKRCVVVMSTVVARTSAVRASGGFDATLSHCEDLDLWIRMLLAGASLAYVRDALVLRRIHASNMSNNGNAMVEGVLRIIDRYAAVAGLAEQERRVLRLREHRLKARCHENLARVAIAAGEPSAARVEFWNAFRKQKSAGRLAATLAFTLLPSLALVLARHWWRSRLRRDAAGSLAPGSEPAQEPEV